jgi:hypothetical protein
MKKGRATKRKTFIDCRHRNDIPPLLPVIVLHLYAPSFRLAQTQQYPGVQYFVFFRHRQEIESMVAAKDRLWLIKIY